MKAIFFFQLSVALLFAATPVSAQKARILEQKQGSISFEVDQNLPEPNNSYLFKGYTQAERDRGLAGNDLKNLFIATSFRDTPMVLDDTPFYTGMVRAFADHRPITLSPDVIWTLICQAFSHDVNADPEKFRDKLVGFDGKIDLIVQTGEPLYSPNFDWTATIDGFAAKIEENTKNDVAKLITADFSTTGTTERLASEIVLMETTKSYFEFFIMYMACGFPSITLTGTVQDWQTIVDKTARLRELGAGKWVSDLNPILEQFVEAAKGNPDQAFWQDIVMKNTPDRLRGGACSDEEPTQLDGWFLKFMPYDKDGNPTPSKIRHTYNNFPKQMASAPVNYIVVDPFTGQVIESIPLELSGGIAGYMADENGCVSFQLGWTVTKSQKDLAIKKLKDSDGWVHLRVSKIPEELRVIKHYDLLQLDFTGKVEIPEWFYKLDIDLLIIKGNVSPAQKRKLKRHLGKDRVTIR